ncbi:putative Chloride channel [Rhodotorula toruloides ATCC 204091]|uniref:Putative chloride channel n=1 Tax=Rhodotorula toruloides TaxID=5286 RepID=A0A0K3CH14_RHOTO|nr:putative Chloride channel [Rhodotorula toruloides ATCC 204091]KAK4332315.1 putative Chloride channel [Rhodotorula toruloides]PRQ72585.1 putative chloride channel [Rhodotorula toruloides]
MGRDYWASVWLAFGAYVRAPELYLAAKLYYDVFQGPLMALSLIHLRQANGTLDGGVASRLPSELWTMLDSAVHEAAQAMLEMAVHDLTVASTCDECRIELPKAKVLLSWGDNPYVASTRSWHGCRACEKKAQSSTGHIYSLNVLPFLEEYGLTTEWYKHPESYEVEDYVPGYQTAEELEETEKYGNREVDVRARVLLQPFDLLAAEQLRKCGTSTSCGYDEREFGSSQVLTRDKLCKVLQDPHLLNLYRRFFADWPMGADGAKTEPQLHLRCVGQSG